MVIRLHVAEVSDGVPYMFAIHMVSRVKWQTWDGLNSQFPHLENPDIAVVSARNALNWHCPQLGTTTTTTTWYPNVCRYQMFHNVHDYICIYISYLRI